MRLVFVTLYDFGRFRAVIEMLKPEKPDSATTLKGLDYIDVPGLSKREYRLNFFAHKEGTFSAKVRQFIAFYTTYFLSFVFFGIRNFQCTHSNTKTRTRLVREKYN